eukprot:TRINITY_DN3557_c1_g1_i2.p1 TRINITY_DN3557_c1_g1~~TRINITY_DN3557_c1_g1_i2.p1  ORF type:complete len:183 (+),score=93.94 TRINITY_DN3557_c1_g1_i2:190-738(+)
MLFVCCLQFAVCPFFPSFFFFFFFSFFFLLPRGTSMKFFLFGVLALCGAPLAAECGATPSARKEADVHFHAALELGGADDAAAIGLLHKAVAADPSHGAAHYMLGNLEGALGRTAEAIGHYRAAVKVDPESKESHYNLGVMLHDSDPKLALEHFREAVRIDPTFQAAKENIDILTSIEHDEL